MFSHEFAVAPNRQYDESYALMEEQVREIWESEEKIISRIKLCIGVVSSVLEELRNSVNDASFDTKEQEIHFFKSIKPRFYSYLIYYLKLLRIETKKPAGAAHTVEQYLQEELRRLTYFFENNQEFYQYYRTGSTYLDEIYFLRSKQNIYFTLDEHYFCSDPVFSTSHDHKIAKILANELLRIYLNQALERLGEYGPASSSGLLQKLPLQWTGAKTSLIELIYALQSSGVFNNSSADIKLIAVYFQKIFKVDLGNYYRVFQEIRIRKKTRTQFLDQLTRTLIQRMDETDENYRY